MKCEYVYGRYGKLHRVGDVCGEKAVDIIVVEQVWMHFCRKHSDREMRALQKYYTLLPVRRTAIRDATGGVGVKP